jgi:hypothetical protein
VVLVDNGSADGSLQILAREFPKIARVELKENRGFCGGANAGANYAIRELGATALFFLNNDAWVDPGFLRPLEEALERDPKTGCTGSRVMWGDGSGRVWCAGGALRLRENVSALIGWNRSPESLPRREYECDYIPGCAMLVRADLFTKLGGFDESYFAYMEDVDFGVRVTREGYKNRVVPDSVVFHRPSSSSGGGYSRARKYANGLNSVKFLRAHGRFLSWCAFWIFDICLLPVAWLREWIRGGDPGAVRAKWRGIRAGFAGARVTSDALESLAKKH